jgi:DNA-binding winged helix-turn-helix (wHTH) protein/Tfp pilus assembly protein PilF
MSPALLEFGPFRFDAAKRLLWREAELVPLTPKALELLCVLVEQRGQLVRKHELLQRVWPDTFVEEANLSVNVSALRKALGRQRDGKPYIETLARRGYRFVAAVREARTAPRSLAVLPFRPLDTLGGDETLGLGMADAIITRLSRIGRFQVRPTAAVVKYAAADPREAARELLVDAVLDGRIQHASERVRASVQLLSAQDGTPIWAETFDEPFTNIFAVQDSVSERVARALAEQLTAADRDRLRRRETRSIEAQQAYLRGRYFWNKLTGPWLSKARQCFEEAVARDPEYALAHAGLADTITMLGLYGLVPPRDAWPRAQSAAETAVALDDTLAEAHVSLAYVRLFRDWSWHEAAAQLTRAVELSPSSALVRLWHALFLGMNGRFEAAMAEVQRAQELDPISLTVSTGLGFHLAFVQKHDGEIEQHRRTLEMEPDYAIGHWALGLAYEHKQQYEDAVGEYRKAVELSGGAPPFRGNLARALVLAGRAGEAREILAALEREADAGHGSPFRIATVYEALRDLDAAIGWLERGVQERDHWMVLLKIDPMLERVRSHARFGELVERVGSL